MTLTSTPGYLVLDPDLPDRPPLAHADDHDTALLVIQQLQQQFYNQLRANGEGGGRAQLALVLAPIDATGTIGPTCYWSTVNGIPPTIATVAQRDP